MVPKSYHEQKIDPRNSKGIKSAFCAMNILSYCDVMYRGNIEKYRVVCI
jgi:hypothetical protein